MQSKINKPQKRIPSGPIPIRCKHCGSAKIRRRANDDGTWAVACFNCTRLYSVGTKRRP